MRPAGLDTKVRATIVKSNCLRLYSTWSVNDGWESQGSHQTILEQRTLRKVSRRLTILRTQDGQYDLSIVEMSASDAPKPGVFVERDA